MGETDKGRALHSVADVQFAGSEGEEVLRALDGVLEAAKQKLEVFPALDEVDLRGVDGRRRNSERKNVRRRARPTLAPVGANLARSNLYPDFFSLLLLRWRQVPRPSPVLPNRTILDS